MWPANVNFDDIFLLFYQADTIIRPSGSLDLNRDRTPVSVFGTDNNLLFT